MAEHRTELLLVRTRLDPAVNIILAQGVRASLAWRGDENPRVRSFFLTDQNGSWKRNRCLPKCGRAKPTPASRSRNSKQAAPGKGLIAHIFASELSEIVAKSPEVTVSPDVDVSASYSCPMTCRAPRIDRRSSRISNHPSRSNRVAVRSIPPNRVRAREGRSNFPGRRSVRTSFAQRTDFQGHSSVLNGQCSLSLKTSS